MAWRLSRVSSPSSSTLESPKAGGAASGRCFPGFGFVKAHARGKAPPTPSCKLYVSTTKLKLRDQTSIRLVKQPSTKMALTCDTIEEEAGTFPAQDRRAPRHAPRRRQRRAGRAVLRGRRRVLVDVRRGVDARLDPRRHVRGQLCLQGSLTHLRRVFFATFFRNKSGQRGPSLLLPQHQLRRRPSTDHRRHSLRMALSLTSTAGSDGRLLPRRVLLPRRGVTLPRGIQCFLLGRRVS